MTRTLQAAALLAALPHLIHRAQTVAAEFDAAVENEELANQAIDNPDSVAATLERISKDFAEIAAGIRAVHVVTLGSDNYSDSDSDSAPAIPDTVRVKTTEMLPLDELADLHRTRIGSVPRSGPTLLQRAEASAHHQAFNLDCPVGVADTIAQSAEALAARNHEVQRRASSADGTGIVGEDTH